MELFPEIETSGLRLTAVVAADIKEGVLKEHVYKNGAFHNIIVYGLTRSDYIQL